MCGARHVPGVPGVSSASVIPACRDLSRVSPSPGIRAPSQEAGRATGRAKGDSQRTSGWTDGQREKPQNVGACGTAWDAIQTSPNNCEKCYRQTGCLMTMVTHMMEEGVAHWGCCLQEFPGVLSGWEAQKPVRPSGTCTQTGHRLGVQSKAVGSWVTGRTACTAETSPSPDF